MDLGGTIAFWERDPQKIIPNLMEIKPTYFPSVPRIFEKIYTLANSVGDPAEIKQAVEVGFKVRQLQEAGKEVPAELQAAFDQADQALFQNVRNLFGGRIRQCVTGAAPIASEILEFFYACGVPVMEGYGMTETSTVATRQPRRRVPLRLGGQAAAGRRGEDRRGRRGAAARRQHLPGLLQERGGHDTRRSSTAGCTPATSARSTRTASSSSPAARRTSSSRPAARTSPPPTSRTGSSRTAGSRRPWWSAIGARTWSR